MHASARQALFACQAQCQSLYETPSLAIALWRSLSTSNIPPENESLPLTVASFQVWGANTGVGKSLLSAGLFRKAAESHKVCYLKPVQTGFPEDSDARLMGAVTGLAPSLGRHAAELAEERAQQPAYGEHVVHTDFAWRQPVSPHLAVETEGRPVEDAAIRQSVLRHLLAFAAAQRGQPALALIETAGGPASPAPSGRLQCDLHRPLRMPSLLVGDGKLGGISTTLAAHEMLSHRGYDTAAVALIEGGDGPNAAALERQLRKGPGPEVPVFRLPACAVPSGRLSGESGSVDAELRKWLEESDPELDKLLHHLLHFHAQRVLELKQLAGSTLQHIWYPFTQHRGLQQRDITVIDARAGDELLVFKRSDESAASQDRVEAQFDACASWWTQGVNADIHPLLIGEITKGIARYGHVMHPNAAIEPTLQLAKLLLDSVGKGWASRVFYSDDGSTAVEVALKMAFRKFWKDHPEVNVGGADGGPRCELKVLGIDGGYHGDTLGAMDAVAPSPYNGPAQFPWYKGRGLFLMAPYVGITQGSWRLQGAAASQETWSSFEELLKPCRQQSKAAQRYREEINLAIDRFEASEDGDSAPARLAACIVEPILQGAGGMLMVDPLFQQCLVEISRQRRIPVIFDEVFTGLWRLGAPSAAEILGLQPDIACYAKLLTGGILPLSATLATDEVFKTFDGDSKLDALLHGHSYSGHAAGASAGVAALRIFSRPDLNPALEPSGGRLKQLWPADLVDELSRTRGVKYVVAIGTVLAAELSSNDGTGYASGASVAVVQKLRAKGIFARPLGSVVYLMLTPTTRQEKAAALLRSLLEALRND